MAISTATLTVWRGQRATLDFTTSDWGNISGWSITFTVARRRSKARQDELTRLYTAESAKVVSQAAEIVDGPTGAYRVTLTSTQTNLVSGIYEYDAWRTDADREVPLAVGEFVVAGVVRLPV